MSTSPSPDFDVATSYIEILSAFVEGKTDPPTFEMTYLEFFKNDHRSMSSHVFHILDKLFSDVDDYVSDPELRARAGGLDDDELLACARRALRALRESPQR